jgi:hypothetical protein
MTQRKKIHSSIMKYFWNCNGTVLESVLRHLISSIHINLHDYLKRINRIRFNMIATLIFSKTHLAFVEMRVLNRLVTVIKYGVTRADEKFFPKLTLFNGLMFKIALKTLCLRDSICGLLCYSMHGYYFYNFHQLLYLYSDSLNIPPELITYA